MATNTVIIVPAQDKHASMFAEVAKYLNRNVYGKKAAVVKATVTKSGKSFAVTFSKLDGESFSWEHVKALSSILTISHGAIVDGPSFDHQQPWNTTRIPGVPDGYGGFTDGYGGLSTEGTSFWKSMGNELKSGGKIILVGCNMGKEFSYRSPSADAYAQLVADTAKRAVYASNGFFSAADNDTTVRHVKAIEKGSAIRPMKRFNPSRDDLPNV